MQSMVRFLLYANEFDEEGLVASAGTLAVVADRNNILDVLYEYENAERYKQNQFEKYHPLKIETKTEY